MVAAALEIGQEWRSLTGDAGEGAVFFGFRDARVVERVRCHNRPRRVVVDNSIPTQGSLEWRYQIVDSQASNNLVSLPFRERGGVAIAA